MIYTLFCSCRKTRPFRINRLGTLCAGAKTSTPLFSVHCALFCKMGGWVPQHFRAELRSRRHMHHVAPLSPVASLGCAYFPSPRGCTVYYPPPENKITRTAGLRRDPVLRLAWPAANRLVHPPRR